MSETNCPFTGDVTTLTQVHEALASQGFPEDSRHVEVEIPEPFRRDGIASGPLDEALVGCKPYHLAKGWPVVFRVSVKSMLEKAGYVATE